VRIPFQKGEILTTGRVHWRAPRILIAALAAVGLTAAFLQYPGHSQGAGSGTQPSLNVAVIPGFKPPVYPGSFGVSAFPAGAQQLSAYHFSQLPTNQVKASALSKYDTVVLYGIRWREIPTSGQAAINAFAATHKVMIWDADGTGPQNYSNFIHPFSDLASGEENTNPEASVVSFPTGVNFLASDQPDSPYYLDPDQLVTNRDEINHMSAMTTGTKNWVPALFAANAKIPKGGWPLAWSYGVIGNHTGLTIYSGIDADAFGDKQLNPNYAIKELALQLQAQFRQTPDTSCAPGCTLPSSSGGPPHAACSLTKLPKHWVHGRVPVWLKTSVAAGITGRVLAPSGRILASGKEQGDTIHFRVRTRPLRSNHTSRLRALVFVNGQQACSLSFRLKVDNTPPRLLYLATLHFSHLHLARLRVSEVSGLTVVGRHVPHHRRVLIAAHRTINVRLPTSVHKARLTLRDRAGNTVVRKLVW
jgi:hypothetical protein